jgi:hypothetical protein
MDGAEKVPFTFSYGNRTFTVMIIPIYNENHLSVLDEEQPYDTPWHHITSQARIIHKSQPEDPPEEEPEHPPEADEGDHLTLVSSNDWVFNCSTEDIINAGDIFRLNGAEIVLEHYSGWWPLFTLQYRGTNSQFTIMAVLGDTAITLSRQSNAEFPLDYIIQNTRIIHQTSQSSG